MTLRRRIGARLELLRWVFFAEPAPPRAWTHILPALATVLAASSINATCQSAGWYERLEWVDLDRLQTSAMRRGPAANVTLVLITDREYEDPALFRNTSPLDPDAIVRIVRAVCGFGPAIVGVDLLTSDWPPDGDRLASLGAPCHVIWSQDVLEPESAERSNDDPPLMVLLPGKVLGREGAPAGGCAALPVLARDSDGVVRYYRARHPVRRENAGIEYEPTLAWALAGGANGHRCVGGANAEADTTPRKIRFTHNATITRVHARHVLEAVDEGAASLRQSLTSLLAGRTVIIGGAYRHGRDVHATSVGPLQGAEVTANAVLTETDPIVSVDPWLSLAVDIAVGVVLLLVIVRLRLRWLWALIASSLGAAAAAFVISWTLFNYTGYFLAVFGSLAGVVVGVLVDLWWEAAWRRWKEWRAEFEVRRAEISARVRRADVQEEN